MSREIKAKKQLKFLLNVLLLRNTLHFVKCLISVINGNYNIIIVIALL